MQTEREKLKGEIERKLFIIVCSSQNGKQNFELVHRLSRFIPNTAFWKLHQEE